MVEQGRVAIGDEIGATLTTALVAVLIGERPGLSAPESLGVYFTWAPAVGRSDAERNCLSNIHPAGMGYGEAAAKLVYLLSEARRRRLSGVMLKEDTDDQRISTSTKIISSDPALPTSCSTPAERK